MTPDKNKRTNKKDRRETSDERSEKFIKYFTPEEEEKRSGKDRRESTSDNK